MGISSSSGAEQRRGPETVHIGREHEKLLRFLYLCPIGIVESARDGQVRMLNAVATQLLMPLSRGGALDNVVALLSPFDPDLPGIAARRASGSLCEGRRIVIPPRDPDAAATHLAVSIRGIDDDTLMTTLTDVTATVAAEEAAWAALEQGALHRGRIDISTSILHDIGNAVTGILPRAARVAAETEWPERESLRRLHGLFADREAQLSEVFGPGKGGALVELTRSIEEALGKRFVEWRDAVSLFTRSIAHVQEIIARQRVLVPDGANGPRALVDVGLVVDHSLLLQRADLERRGIRVTRRIDPTLPLIPGDRTQLTQLVVNLLRNASEAFEDPALTGAPHIRITAGVRGHGLEVSVTDNGAGLSASLLERVFARGTTTKATGSGIGLCSCREVAEAHGGTIHLTSGGAGRGATATLRLPLLREGAHR